MAKKMDDSKKIIDLLRGVPGAKISSIEIEFEDPSEDPAGKSNESDMKDQIIQEILKQRSKKK